MLLSDHSPARAATSVPEPNQTIPTGGNGGVRSTGTTGRRATRGVVRIIAIGNGMMTIVMDHRTAPPGRSAGSAVLDRPLDDPLRGSRPYATPRRSPVPRRLGVGVLAGALTMFVVALLDTVTGAQVPVLGSFASLPVPAGQEVVEVAPPPATPGTCLTWTKADASDTRVVDCGQTHL
ncbi:MAG: hypothetical protein QOK35_204, partial [Pseudonocardiales bacterium]|nr:hypothetical protein [Pseudonocardiales bacterium]